jgi:DNA repair protein REV1
VITFYGLITGFKLQAEHFLVSLSNEVSARLQTAAARGKTITLKVKRRKEGEGEPVKFMGCGVCDSFSRSESVACATDSADVLLQISRQLFNSFHLGMHLMSQDLCSLQSC